MEKRCCEPDIAFTRIHKIDCKYAIKMGFPITSINNKHNAYRAELPPIHKALISKRVMDTKYSLLK